MDTLLVLRGFTESRERAKALILCGEVLVNGKKTQSAGAQVDSNAEIVLLKQSFPYVSRGGLKLEAALKDFEIDISGGVAMDVGASTGGFTDCLLKKGANRVYAVDVGYGQLAWPLRQDKRVVVLERQNIRYLPTALVPETLDLITIDVSFISLHIVIPSVLPLLKKNGRLIALIKPQFEVGKNAVGKGGIVKDPVKHQTVIAQIRDKAEEWRLQEKGLITSPIKGQKGNVEFLIYFKKCGDEI